MIDIKIEKAKKDFLNVQKSGKNNYQHFKYLELKDITPIVRDVCERYNMRTKFTSKEGVYVLIITDNEDATTAEYEIPIPQITDSDAGRFMQNVGRVRTYAKRYLYIDAFEISVPDEIDNKNQDEIPKNTKKTKGTSKPDKKNEVTDKTKGGVDNILEGLKFDFTMGGVTLNLENARRYLERKKNNKRITEAEMEQVLNTLKLEGAL